MKAKASLSEDRLPVMEEGSMLRLEKSAVPFRKRVNTSSSCEKIVQIGKIILCIELIFFVGWLGCILISSHLERPREVSTFRLFDEGEMSDAADFEFPRFRHERSVEEDNAKRNVCMESVQATRQKVNTLSSSFIPGEDSDLEVTELRQKTRRMLIQLVTQVMFMDLMNTKDTEAPSEEEWTGFVNEIRAKMVNETDEQHANAITGNAITVPQLRDQLRTTINSMASDYKNCESVLPFGVPTTSPTLADLFKEREKCSKLNESLKQDLDPFERHIVPGEVSDPSVLQLRQKVENMGLLLAESLPIGQSVGWNLSEISTEVANLTDDQWKTHITKIKEDLANSTDTEHRQQLEQSGPPTTEMVNELRAAVVNYLTNYGNCELLKAVLGEIRKYVNVNSVRFRRDAPVEWGHWD